MEEVYGGEPFGTISSSNVPLGKGSIAGLKVLLQRSPLPKRNEARQNKRTQGVVWMDKMLTPESYDKIMQELHDLPQQQLDVLLLFRDPYDHMCLRNKLNGRNVNAVDIEHFLCKIYILLRLKSPVALATLKPASTSNIAHPIKTTLKQQLQYRDQLKPIFDTAIHSWQTFVLHSKIWTPPPFLFQQEMQRYLHNSSSTFSQIAPLQDDYPHSISNSS